MGVIDNVFENAVGRAILKLRRERKLTQSEASRKGQLSHPEWSKVEAGHHWPSRRTMVCICKGLDIEPSEIFFEIGNILNCNELEER